MLLKKVLPTKVFERIVGQIIADMREECFDALRDGNFPRYRAASTHGHIAIGLALAFWLWGAVGRRLFEIWKVVK